MLPLREFSAFFGRIYCLVLLLPGESSVFSSFLWENPLLSSAFFRWILCPLLLLPGESSVFSCFLWDYPLLSSAFFGRILCPLLLLPGESHLSLLLHLYRWVNGFLQLHSLRRFWEKCHENRRFPINMQGFLIRVEPLAIEWVDWRIERKKNIGISTDPKPSGTRKFSVFFLFLWGILTNPPIFKLF